MTTLMTSESLAVELLAKHGFDVSVLSSVDIRMAADGEEFDAHIVVRRSATYEWDVQQLLNSKDRSILLVVPRASNAVIAVAKHDLRLSVVSLDDQVVVWRGKRRELEVDARTSTPQSVSRRSPWGRWALMRVLALSERGRTQVDLANATGISQPAVSLALKRLGGLVERSPEGWKASDRSRMWDEFLDDYAGPGGVSSYWFGLDEVAQQVGSASSLAKASQVDTLLSGHSAADLIAPWRIPARSVVYARSALDLRLQGFAESKPSKATLVVTVPADATLWSTASDWSNDSTVDPLIASWDLRRSGGSDADEAAEQIKARVLRLDA